MNEPKIATIEVASHYFKVSQITSWPLRTHLTEFARGLIHNTSMPSPDGSVKVIPLAVYAASNESRSEYRFHICHKQDFFKSLYGRAQIKESDFDWVTRPPYDCDPVEWIVKTDKQPRDYQKKLIEEYLLNPNTYRKILQLATGRGKGLTSLMAVKETKKRVLVITKAGYLVKWKEEICEFFRMEKEDTLVVSGSAALQKLLKAAIDGKHLPKAIMVSISTLNNWQKICTYAPPEQQKELGWPIQPDRLHETLRIHTALTDEAHMHWHGHFISDLHTHVPLSIAMTATLKSRDAFLKRIYTDVYPVKDRHEDLAPSKHVDVRAVHFCFANVQRVKTTHRGSTFHAPGAIEDSILASRSMLQNWRGLVNTLVREHYLPIKRERKVLLVLSYLKEMVRVLAESTSREFPQYKVSTYIDKDPDSNLHESDIVFSSVGSAGTAHDIKDLSMVLLVRDLDAIQATIQVLGRLRPLPDGHPVLYMYTVADNIPRSLAYHQTRLKEYGNLARTHWDIHYQHAI